MAGCIAAINTGDKSQPKPTTLPSERFSWMGRADWASIHNTDSFRYSLVTGLKPGLPHGLRQALAASRERVRHAIRFLPTESFRPQMLAQQKWGGPVLRIRPNREVVDVSAVRLRSFHRNPDESGGQPEGHLDGQIGTSANDR